MAVMKGVCNYDAFTEDLKHGNPLTLVPSKIITAEIFSFYGGLSDIVYLC